MTSRRVLSLYRQPVGCLCRCLGYRSWSTIPALLYEREPHEWSCGTRVGSRPEFSSDNRTAMRTSAGSRPQN